MAAVNNDNKSPYAQGRDGASAEAGIPTGEKVDIQHVEKLDTTEAIVGVKASQVYENMAPIVELGLPDWRATEKQLVRRLDVSLMPTSEYIDTLFDMIDQHGVVANNRFTSLVALFQQLPRPH
jgi:hypothetical protein